MKKENGAGGMYLIPRRIIDYYLLIHSIETSEQHARTD